MTISVYTIHTYLSPTDMCHPKLDIGVKEREREFGEVNEVEYEVSHVLQKVVNLYTTEDMRAIHIPLLAKGDWVE
jgi:hypothetical protein